MILYVGVSHLVQTHNLFTYFTNRNFFLCSKIWKQIMSLGQIWWETPLSLTQSRARLRDLSYLKKPCRTLFVTQRSRTKISSLEKLFWTRQSLWIMFENEQIAAVFERNCRRFRNSFECLNTHCAENNWPILTQKVPKEA